MNHSAYYRKIFEEGTQLIISNQPVKEPEVVIFKSSIKDAIREGFAIYMCSLQNFFPGVIRVVWNEADSGKEVESEQDLIEHNTESNTYSLNSWIKVMNSDLGKRFTCKYKHEKNGERWIMNFVLGYEYLQDQPVKEPEVTIFKSSKMEVAREGFAIYTCSLQNFFPEAIRVVWNEGDSEQEVESQQGEIKYNTDSNTYSLSSSIKVPKYDLRKIFTCKYNQRTTKEGWKNISVSGNEYIQDQPVKEPEVTIFKSSKIEVAREGFAIYTCSLQNFFPEVIRVVWNEGDCEQEVESQQGEIKYNTDNNTYSLNSSIKVPKYDLRKTFTCKYNQRTTKEGWKNISVSGNEYIQGTPHLKHMTYRAAQITYAVLLLKSVLYCPLLIFLKSKVKP